MASIEKYFKARTGVDTPDLLTSSATVYDYLKTPLVYFDTTASAINNIGGLVWDDVDGTLSLRLKGGNVDLSLGQEEVALCYNGTASALIDGTVVYVTGSQGQRPRIAKASASSESSSSKTFGVVTEPILNGEEGFVTTFGLVRGLNTASYSEGAALWLSTTPGQFTTTMPTAPNHAVFIGYCIRSHQSSGEIFVKIQNGYELEELHNVLISSASNNHILSYNSASSLWVNKGLQDAIKEVDGSTSGIDADLLDGQHGSYYAPIDSPTFTGSVNAPEPTTASNVATKNYVDSAISSGGVVLSSASAYPSSAADYTLFFNTTAERVAVRVGSIWKELAFVTDVPITGGDSETLVFAGAVDGGDSSTTVFTNNYDGGES